MKTSIREQPMGDCVAQRQGTQTWTRVWCAIAAHVLELAHAGVIDDAALAALARGLDAAHEPEGGPDGLTAVITAIDQRVDALVPTAASGVTSLGRRHHEMRVTVLRLAARDVALEMMGAVDDLRAALHQLAGDHVFTYLPGLVDGQPAEPTTLANMLGATLDPLAQMAKCLRAVYDRINRAPLGAGLLAGDVLELDRAALADRLGFTTVLNPTFNAASNVEDLVALMQAIGAALAPVARLLEEASLWLRVDPDSFRLDDAWLDTPEPGMTSLNAPGGLRRLIQSCDRAVQQADVLVAHLRSLGYGPIGTAIDALLTDLDALASASRRALNESATLFASGITPNRAYLANRVGRGLITSSDLALYLVTEEGLPLTAARQIAGMVVARALEGGSGLVGITPDAIDTAAMLVIGQDVKTEMEPLGRYFAPRRYLERRRVAGAPSPDMTRAWLAESQRQLDADRAWLDAERDRLEAVVDALNQAITDAAAEED